MKRKAPQQPRGRYPEALYQAYEGHAFSVIKRTTEAITVVWHNGTPVTHTDYWERKPWKPGGWQMVYRL